MTSQTLMSSASCIRLQKDIACCLLNPDSGAILLQLRGDCPPGLLMSPMLLLVFYCALILLASLAGGWIPLLVRLTHTRLQLAMSFVGGAMLGVGMLNLLPHAYYELENIQQTVGWLMIG